MVTKDARFSVAYYSIGYEHALPTWDLYITNVRLSDAANYQCHVVTKNNLKSIRSNVKLIVKGKKSKNEIRRSHGHHSMFT